MKVFNRISNKYIKFMLLLSVVSLVFYSCTESDKDELYEFDNGIYYLELDGSPSQMGQKQWLLGAGKRNPGR